MKPRGHKAGLDKAAVIDAAAELVNEKGIEALTLNRLAARLGVRTPSLYNHVDGLAGLQRELALLSTRDLADRLASAAVAKSGRAAVVQIAQAYRAFVKQHPGLYTAGIRSAGVGGADPELQAAQERAVGIVLAVVGSFGLSGKDALHAVRGLRSVVHGFATLETAGGFGLPLDCDESFRRLVLVLVRGLEQPVEREPAKTSALKRRKGQVE